MTSYTDEDGNIDYEAHCEAGQKARAASTAQALGKPELSEALAYFGLGEDPAEQFTPELTGALEAWAALVKRIDDAPVDREIKDLYRQAERMRGKIDALAEQASQTAEAATAAKAQEEADTAALAAGVEGLDDAIDYFELTEVPELSPELITALHAWERLFEEINAAPYFRDITDLRKKAEELRGKIKALAERARQGA